MLVMVVFFIALMCIHLSMPLLRFVLLVLILLLLPTLNFLPFFFSSRRRHTRYIGDWSSDVCSSDLSRMEALKFPQELSPTTPRMSGDKGKDVLPFVSERISGAARRAQCLGAADGFLAPLARVFHVLCTGKADRKSVV